MAPLLPDRSQVYGPPTAPPGGSSDLGNPTTGGSDTYNNISFGGTAFRAKADAWDTGTLALTDTTVSTLLTSDCV